MAMSRTAMPKRLQGGRKRKETPAEDAMDKRMGMAEDSPADVMSDTMQMKPAKRGTPARNLRGR